NGVVPSTRAISASARRRSGIGKSRWCVSEVFGRLCCERSRKMGLRLMALSQPVSTWELHSKTSFGWYGTLPYLSSGGTGHYQRMVKHGIREAGSIDVSAAMALGYASQTAFAMAFRRLTRRNPEQLATARTLTAISLQVPQSLWGGGGPGSLGSSTSTGNATMKSAPYCRLPR